MKNKNRMENSGLRYRKPLYGAEPSSGQWKEKKKLWLQKKLVEKLPFSPKEAVVCVFPGRFLNMHVFK